MEKVNAFKITSMNVQGFKCFDEERGFAFGGMNIISGHNGQGKSSIADAIAFAVTGTSFFGSARIDRLYNDQGKMLTVAIEYEDENGKPHNLTRRRKNDRMDIEHDGIMVRQTDMNAAFGERDIFLSIFNPLYFIERLGDDGRNLLERYLPAIPHETVLGHLNEKTRELLKGEKISSSESYLRNRREELNEARNQITYLTGQRDLLAQQEDRRMADLIEKRAELHGIADRAEALEAKKAGGIYAEAKERLAGLYARHDELYCEKDTLPDTEKLDQEIREASQKLERRRASAYESKYALAIAGIAAEVNALKASYERETRVLNAIKPGIRCGSCRQTVTEQGIPALKREYQNAIGRIVADGREKTAQMKELEALDQEAREAFERFKCDDVSKYENKLARLEEDRKRIVKESAEQSELRQTELKRLKDDIQALEFEMENGALTAEEAVELAMLAESKRALETEIRGLSPEGPKPLEGLEGKEDEIQALKDKESSLKTLISVAIAYVSKRAELTFEGFGLNKASVSLYDIVKTTGEVKDTFKFTFDGRPYAWLSLSEKIKAGLEISELIKRLTGRSYPVFIDNGESVPAIDNVRPSGQIFMAQVAKGMRLTVKSAASPHENRGGGMKAA